VNIDALILSLAEDIAPIRPGAARRRIGVGAIAGTLVAVIILLITYGLRPDIDTAMAGTMFWMKISYTASLALVAVSAAVVLARPEASPPGWLWLLVVPIIALCGVSGLELASAPIGHRTAMWLGRTWQFCPPIVAMLSIPVMIAVMIAFRRFAPTRLRLTGAVIGLGAGASAATVYCLHCPEATATFVLSWYSLGIGIATVIGAIIGPRALRW
jgi:hypothetical protein